MTADPMTEAVESCKQLEKLVHEFVVLHRIKYLALVKLGRVYLGIEDGVSDENFDRLLRRVDREFRYCCRGEFEYNRLEMENDEQTVYFQRFIVDKAMIPHFLFAIVSPDVRDVKREIIGFADKLSALLKYL
jgi:hypothetical protein